jgi:hypothetical protein
MNIGLMTTGRSAASDLQTSDLQTINTINNENNITC